MLSANINKSISAMSEICSLLTLNATDLRSKMIPFNDYNY